MRLQEKDARSSVGIVVIPAAGLIDGPLHVLLRGLPPGESVTLQARLLDARGLPWRSSTTIAAGDDGVATVDGTQLIESLTIAAKGVSRPFDNTSVAPLTVELMAECGDRTIATAEAERLYVADDVLTTRLRNRDLSGLFFRPKAGDPRPGIVVLGGSSGGVFWASQVAALLASHGFAALALAYFDFDELPRQLVEIPIEYFATALEWLRSQPDVRSDALGAVGISRGAELALILGSRFPALRSVVAYCPSNIVWNGLYGDRPADLPAWTESGRAIPYFSLMAPALTAARESVFRVSPVPLTPLFEAAVDGPIPDDAFIPVERTNGPILLVSGDADRMWPATRMGSHIMDRLAAHGHRFRSRHLHYPNAGHLMRPPVVSTRVLDGKFALGGEPRAQAAANRAAWSETVAFLRESLGLSTGVDALAVAGGSLCR